MGLREDLESQVKTIFRERWQERQGTAVPESDNIALSNDGVILDAVVLYADMADSTSLVDTYSPTFAAEIYKAYLHCAAKIIRAWDGEITAYDGDRIMAVFLGDAKNSWAVTAALKLNYARLYIINPAIKSQYPDVTYELQHVVGIDTSKLTVARTGIRGANDLVWVGRSANHAAKLTALNHHSTTRITKEVYDRLNSEAKLDDRTNMWEPLTWTETGRSIYGSNYFWGI